MALNLDSLQGQAETGESAPAANAFLFQLWAEAPSRGVHDFSLEDRFPLKLPAVFLGGPARRAGQGRAGLGPGGAGRGRPAQARGCGSTPRSDVAGGRGVGEGVAAAARGGPGVFSTFASAAARPAPTRAARAPHALAGSASRPAPAPRCSPRRSRWRSGPGAGGPRRRRCCCCCSG